MPKPNPSMNIRAFKAHVRDRIHYSLYVNITRRVSVCEHKKYLNIITLFHFYYSYLNYYVIIKNSSTIVVQYSILLSILDNS